MSGEPDDIAAKVERSSLGTPEAQALRSTVSDEHAARIVARARELEHTADKDAPEPEFFTAEDIRTLAEQMEWLEDGQIKEAVVSVMAYDRPWAWIWVHPSNGPRAQVTFDPSFVQTCHIPPEVDQS